MESTNATSSAEEQPLQGQPVEGTRGVAFAEPVQESDDNDADETGHKTRRRQSSRSAKRKPSIFEKLVDPYALSASAEEEEEKPAALIDRNLSRMTCAIPKVEIGAAPTEESEEEDLTCLQATQQWLSPSKNIAYMKDNFNYYYNSNMHFLQEVKEECYPSSYLQTPSEGLLERIRSTFFTFVHVPYFPAFHRPGWLLRYIVGPHDWNLWFMFLSDFRAGLTVALTLIPQALSYAKLAGMPPINGLYAAILPSAAYTFFGSSMQLAVGPVAIVSLLMGALVTKYGFVSGSQEAVDLGAQAALVQGIILSSMGILNMGSFINLMSHPVMSGFTTGAAMSIGLSQLSSAFGFLWAPRQGDPGYEYNWQVMQWFAYNWNYTVESPILANTVCGLVDPKNVPSVTKGVLKFSNFCSAKTYYDGGKILNYERFEHMSYQNHYAIKICFGLYVVMFFVQFFKNQLKGTPKRKNQAWYQILSFILPLGPFICLLIGTGIAYRIKKNSDYYYLDLDVKKRYSDIYALALKIVGPVVQGVDIIRIPTFRADWGPFFADMIPLTLISYMESYSVARRLASQVNELHILNASQEMWANGVANLVGSVGSAYPVSSSFSRSSLNAASGAKTPMAKVITLMIVLLALGAISDSFEFIPNAVLSAVIFAAIENLICISDFWEAWKHSKMDFFVMLVTAVITFVFETGTGLAVGIGLSALVYLGTAVLAPAYTPVATEVAKDSEKNIDIVKVNSDITFLTAARIKDFISPLTLLEPVKPDSSLSKGHYYHAVVSSAFDYTFIHRNIKTVASLPSAIVIDLSLTRFCDLTGLQALAEIMFEARVKGVKAVVINEADVVRQQIIHFGIVNDVSSDDVDLDAYLAQSQLPTIGGNKKKEEEEDKEKEKEQEKEVGLEANVVDASSIELTPVQA